MAIALLIDPTAEADAAQHAMRRLRARLGGELTVVPLCAENDLTAAVHRALETMHPRVVIAIGNDAALAAAAAALVDEPAALAMVPTSGESLVCRQLDLPVDVDRACELAADACGTGHTRTIDLMQVGERVVCSRVVMGRLAELDAPHGRGILASLRWGVISLVRLFGHNTRFDMHVDGKPVSIRASSVVVANTGALGVAGLQWDPDIVADDGVIDVIVIRSTTVLDYLALAWGWLVGRSRSRQVMHLRARTRVGLASSRVVAVSRDGIRDRSATLEALVLRGALRLATRDAHDDVLRREPDEPMPPAILIPLPETRAS